MKDKWMKNDILKEQSCLDSEAILQVNQEQSLSTSIIMEKLIEKIRIEKQKRRQKQLMYISIAACLVVIVGVNWDKVTSYASELFTKFSVKTSDGIILVEEPIDFIVTKEPEEFSQEGSIVKGKTYASLDECTEELGITLLKNDLVWAHTYEGKVTLTYPKLDVFNMVIIMDHNYIIGDIQDIEMQGTGMVYKPGSVYGSSLWLTVEFVTNAENNIGSNEEQSNIDLASTESYVGSNGIQAYILKGSGSGDTKAFFFYKNVKYSLTGMVPVEEMKRVIDSFYE